MTVYRDIPDAEIAPDADSLSITAIALRDNVFSIIEGDATAIAAGKQITTDAIQDGAITPAKLSVPWGTRVFAGAILGDNIILDNTMDWKDRFITAHGVGAWFDTLAHAQAFIPGGGSDDKLFHSYYWDRKDAAFEQDASGVPSSNNGQVNLINSFFYSRQGTINRTLNPRIFCQINTTGASNADFAIWINSADGSLNLWMKSTGPDADYVAYNLIIGFSGDQGHY
jgi:hypothetical protein